MKDTLVKQLEIASKFYYDGKPIMTDLEFDSLENKLRELDPDNVYFNTVGAAVTTRGIKVKHSIPMGSLNQVSNMDEIRKWCEAYPDEELIISDKLDGNSIALYYDVDGMFEMAVTRGDGIEGLDATRHVLRMINSGNNVVPRFTDLPGPFVVRGEVIFSVGEFERSVTGYKNPRNFVAGQLNSEVATNEFINYASIIIFDSDLEYKRKNTMYMALDDAGFTCVHRHSRIVSYFLDEVTTEDFTAHLEDCKKYSDVELDGLVVEFNSSKIRNEMGFDNLNPRFAVKFKVNTEFVETEVLRVEWNASKDGYMKPRVEFEPVDLGGVTISFATGHNAKFILDNNIGPGAIVIISRSGEVIPKIEKVLSPMPIENLI